MDSKIMSKLYMDRAGHAWTVTKAGRAWTMSICSQRCKWGGAFLFKSREQPHAYRK